MATFNQPAIGPYNQKFAGLITMMRLPVAETPDGLDVALCGVPYDMGTFMRPGARSGPAQIREGSRLIRNMNPATKVAPFEMVQCADLGDAPVSPMNPQASQDKIVDYFTAMAAAGAHPLAAGGDHTIPLLILRGLKAGGILTEPLGVVQVDAHADVLQTEGGVFDGDEVNHATFIRLGVEEGLIDPKRSLQIGLRGSQYSADANDFAVDAGMRMIYQHEFDDIGTKAVIKEIRDLATGPMYLTIDIDGLDPSICPGTGYPEPGGLTTREMQMMLRGMQGIALIGADLCEVNAGLDPSGGTALVAAHLLFESLCVLAEAVARRKGRGI